MHVVKKVDLWSVTWTAWTEGEFPSVHRPKIAQLDGGQILQFLFLNVRDLSDFQMSTVSLHYTTYIDGITDH